MNKMDNLSNNNKSDTGDAKKGKNVEPEPKFEKIMNNSKFQTENSKQYYRFISQKLWGCSIEKITKFSTIQYVYSALISEAKKDLIPKLMAFIKSKEELDYLTKLEGEEWKK